MCMTLWASYTSLCMTPRPGYLTVHDSAGQDASLCIMVWGQAQYLYLSTYLSVLDVLEYLVYGNVKVLVLDKMYFPGTIY